MVMKITSLMAALLLGVGFAGGDRARASGDESARPVAGDKPLPAGGSPYFSRVMERLDVGGKSLSFEDHDGRRESFIALANTLLEAVPKDVRGETHIDAAEMVDACGLGLAAASGSSVRKDGEFWLRRGYTYMPGGPHGLGGLLGSGPQALRSPERLPATTDLAFEVHLDATSVPALIRLVAKACGQESAAGELLDEPMPIGKTLQGLLSKMDLHLMMGLDLSAWRMGSNKIAPLDFILQIEGAKDLLPDLLGQLEQGLGKAGACGDRMGWEVPMESPYLHSKPWLLYSPQGVLTLVSRREYLQQVDAAGAKLAGAKEFLTATAHFPKTGNLLFFSSSRMPPAVAWVIRQQAAGQLDREVEPMLDTIVGLLQAKPWSYGVACEANGITTVSEMPFHMDSTLLTAVPLLTMNSVLFVGARAWKKGSDRAGCILNIRNVQQAVRADQNMHKFKEGDPIPWDDIFGEGKFIENKPTCPEGGTYTFLKKFPKVGELALKCSLHDHEPPNHDDW